MLHELNREFGIDHQLRFVEGKGGLPLAIVENQLARAEIYLHGAHVVSFQPTGRNEMLWMSSEATFEHDKPIRGGVPICWPWFSHHPDDPSQPQHGFARTTTWQVVDAKTTDEQTQVTFRMSDSEASSGMFPHQFTLEYIVTVGTQLKMELCCHNQSDHGFVAGAALHTYLRVDDITNVRVEGLAGRTFIDQLDDHQKKIQSGPIHFRQETDRIYMDTPDEVLVHGNRGDVIRVTKLGSLSTVVWNPWIDKSARMADFPDNGYNTMVCIESTNAATDVRKIAANETHTLQQTIGYL